MRATVMRNRRLVVDELQDPVPQAGEVLVKTVACGICGSDLHALKHLDQFTQFAATTGSGMDPGRDVVMGHEFCGEILDFGPGTQKHLKPGDLVCSVPVLLRNGKAVTVGYSNEVNGGYAERMVLSEPLLLKVPNGLSAEHAALTEPMAVGWHAVQKADLTNDDVALVIGCGPVGLAVINALKASGAAPIIAADYSARRRELAGLLGADVVIDPAANSPYQSWREAAAASAQGQRAEANPLTGERGLPRGVFFECVGVPGVIDQMMVGAERDCRFVVVGVCMESDPIRPLLAITKELSMQFVLGYTPEEFALTLNLIAEGRLPVAPLVTGEVGLDGVAKAFDDLGSPDHHAKILVKPSLA